MVTYMRSKNGIKSANVRIIGSLGPNFVKKIPVDILRITAPPPHYTYKKRSTSADLLLHVDFKKSAPDVLFLVM